MPITLPNVLCSRAGSSPTGIGHRWSHLLLLTGAVLLVPLDAVAARRDTNELLDLPAMVLTPGDLER